MTKLAEKHGLESLLPSSVKSKEWRLDRRLHGLKVKGTGVGERVKGHWWERTLYTRLQKRRQAMLDMPNLIYRWKQVRIVCGTWYGLLMALSLDMDVVGRSGPSDIRAAYCSFVYYYGVGRTVRGVVVIIIYLNWLRTALASACTSICNKRHQGIGTCILRSSVMRSKMFQLPMARYPLCIGINASNMWNLYSSKFDSCLRDKAMKSNLFSWDVFLLLA